ncbi:MAG: NAD(P)/FAD-dependent oxidoreductase [Chlamydiota bacterium]
MSKTASTIKILGAGISGLTAAINLAEEGFRVEVYEQYPEVGQRFHGDLQGLENWSSHEDVVDSLAGMNITMNFSCDPFESMVLTDGKRQQKIIFDRPAFYLVKRGVMTGSLDQGLKQQALDKGVKINMKKTILSSEVDIIATGPRKGENVAVDKGIIFPSDLPDGAYALVDDPAAFKGYGYLLVNKGYGCLCAVTFDKFTHIKKSYQQTLQAFESLLDSAFDSSQDVGGWGSFSVNPEYSRGQALLVGEAAGLQDLLWGFGMRFAFRSGYLAARSIIESHQDKQCQSAQVYLRNAQQEFSECLKAGVVNRYLWEKAGKKLYPFLVRFLGKSSRPRALLSSFYSFNILQRMLYPMARKKMRDRYPQLRW